MDIKGFQVWLSAARGLTRAQRREALAVLSGRSEGEASKAAIELGVDEARRCPALRARAGAVSRGMARGLRRYQCKGCGRTFNALSGTPLSGLHHKERWLSFGASLAKGETVKASAARCDVAVSTAFRWRHRFLAAARSDSEVLKGIVEADETYVLESRKGARGLGAQGTAAGRQGEEARPLARAGAGSHGGGPERDDGQRVAAQGLRRRSRALDPVVAKAPCCVFDCGSSHPPLRWRARALPSKCSTARLGSLFGAICMCGLVNSRNSRLKDCCVPAAASPLPRSGQLPEPVRARRRPRRQRSGADRRRRDEVTPI